MALRGWAGKTSVILSSMLSHHRTNGLWDFYSPKARNGKRYQLACDHCSFVPFSVSVDHCVSPHQKVRKKDGKWLQSERANAHLSNQNKNTKLTQYHEAVLHLSVLAEPYFRVWKSRFQARTKSE